MLSLSGSSTVKVVSKLLLFAPSNVITASSPRFIVDELRAPSIVRLPNEEEPTAMMLANDALLDTEPLKCMVTGLYRILFSPTPNVGLASS